MTDVHGPLRRTLVFVAALIALLASARSGAAPVTVWAVFGVFISVATVWLRGQYADSLDGRQWVIPYRAGLLLLIAAVIMVALPFVPALTGFDKGLLGISGLVLLYLLIGSALTHVRQSGTIRLLRWTVRTCRCGIQFTFVGLATAVAGAALLGLAGRVLLGAVLIGVAVLVMIPAGLALWSEQAVRWLCERDSARAWLWALGLGGAAAFAGATYLGVRVTNSAWLSGVMVVLGLFLVALVSTTQADVVVVMAVVALMGVTPQQTSKHDRPQYQNRERVLVALGDSYMSGEGAAVYYHGTDDGGVNECRRSPSAWAAMAVRDGTRFGGLRFLACSGARTGNVLTEKEITPGAAAERIRLGLPVPQEQPGEPHTQLDAVRLERGAFEPAMVVVSLGGNDAGFSTIGLMCVAPGDCNTERDLWENSTEQVRAQLRATYLEIHQTFPDVPVVVVPYPDPIKINPDEPCDQVALSSDEQLFIQDFLVNRLNRVIRQTAQEYGFHYLAEMQGALAASHLQLCDELNDERPGINFIGLRSVRGIAEQRFNPANWMHTSLHPNELGHAAMLRVFQQWLATHRVMEDPRLPVGAAGAAGNRNALTELRLTTATQVRRDALRAAPPCDLVDTSHQGCRPQAQRWAYREVG